MLRRNTVLKSRKFYFANLWALYVGPSKFKKMENFLFIAVYILAFKVAMFYFKFFAKLPTNGLRECPALKG